MDKSLLKRVAIQSVALMVAVITSSYAFEQYKTVKISASNINQEDVADTSDSAEGIEVVESGMVSIPETVAITGPVIMAASLNDLRGQVDVNIMKQLSKDYLVIKKPNSEQSSIILEDLYVKKSIKINLTGAYQDVPSSSIIMRVRGEHYFLGDPTYTEVITQETDSENGAVKEVITRDYGKDISRGITFTNNIDHETGLSNTEILIELDSVYAYSIYEDRNYFFIDLRKPSEVYDKILVIDPGHGGKDAGALSKNEMYYEKNINLGIVLALKELLDKENIKVYYTRTKDDTVFLRPRVTLANAVDCDYFISIHCNSNEVSSPNGTEVLYYDTEYNSVSSEELANLFSEELGRTIELRNRGIVLKQRKDIFIMDKAEVPMILIEMGYLSNSMDLDYLIDQQKQRIIAQGIYNGIMKAFEELPVSRQE
jgi:N-acetylmuramoyl-L-alanine amidase